MTNPQTDQYAAEVRERKAVTTDSFVVVLAERFAERAPSTIPNLDPVIIGEVMLHLSAQIGGLAISLREQGADTDTILVTICNVLAVAGAQLYSPEQVNPDA